MFFQKYKPYVLWAALALAVGTLAGVLTMEASRNFSETALQPPLSPPQWLFPVVWTVLYALMGISAARIWQQPDSPERRRGLNLWVIQLILNFFWTLIFFNAQAYGFAALWLILLWVVVLLMILTFRKADMLAAWLQVPYLLWLTFALYLNFGVWILNS